MEPVTLAIGALAVLALGVFLGFSLADYVRERMMMLEAWGVGTFRNAAADLKFAGLAQGAVFAFEGPITEEARDALQRRLNRGVRIHPCPAPSADPYEFEGGGDPPSDPHFAVSPESERFLRDLQAEDERAERAMG